MTVTLSHQIEPDFISNVSVPFYNLICCYQEEYQQVVQNILSAQSNQQDVQRLTDIFTKLTENIKLDVSSSGSTAFASRFYQFIVNVQVLILIK